MRHLPGQAAIGAAIAVHRLCTLAITLAVLGSVGVGAISWRLSQGPVDLAWFSGRLEDAANSNGGTTRLAIGSAALAWEGFTKGVDRPLDLRLTDVTVTDQSGRRRINIPRAEVSISLYELLFGRVVPRAVELDEPQLTLVRAKDGAISLDLGRADGGEPAPAAAETPLADLLAELARPAGSDRVRSANALLGQLRRVRVHDARVALVDRQLGVTWRAPHAEIDLTRRPEGGVDGTGTFSLALGDQQAQLTLSAALAAGASENSPSCPAVAGNTA